jgi:hypothetical protein
MVSAYPMARTIMKDIVGWYRWTYDNTVHGTRRRALIVSSAHLALFHQ